MDISQSEEMRANTDLRGLTPYSFYSVVVQAFSLKGAGPRSDPVIVMTMEDGMNSNTSISIFRFKLTCKRIVF